MPRRPKRFDYKSAAKQLRSYGFHVAYGNGKKGTTSPNHKAAARRAWNRVAPLFITNTRQNFKFFPLDKKGLGKMKKSAVAKAQLTPDGVFLRVPKGVKPEKYKFEIGSEGQMISYSTGPRGGLRKETVFDLDPEKLADDPKVAVESLLESQPIPFQARMVVNGNEARIPHDWKSFLEYAPEKIKFILDPNLDPTGEQARLHGGDGMSEEQFADIFQVKVIHQMKGKPSKKKKHAKKKKRSRRR